MGQPWHRHGGRMPFSPTLFYPGWRVGWVATNGPLDCGPCLEAAGIVPSCRRSSSASKAGHSGVVIRLQASRLAPQQRLGRFTGRKLRAFRQRICGFGVPQPGLTAPVGSVWSARGGDIGWEGHFFLYVGREPISARAVSSPPQPGGPRASPAALHVSGGPARWGRGTGRWGCG